MNDTKAKIVTLSDDQTTELRHIWDSQKAKLKPDDFLYVKVRLNRPQAKLTINQLYRLTMTLAGTGFEPIPEWLLAILDPQ